MRGKIDAGPDNYFITVYPIRVYIPLPTAEFLGIKVDQRYQLTSTDDDPGLLYLFPDMRGNVTAKKLNNAIHMDGLTVIRENEFKMGRYLFVRHALYSGLVFKFDKTWI